MKRKTAKEILAESFREVAERKAIDKITIKDITENCGYSPATFYRQFKDKYELIAWDYTRELDHIMSHMDEGEQSWLQTLDAASDYFCSQRDYLANLFLNTSGLDSFVKYMCEIHSASLRKAILRTSGRTELDDRTEMIIRMYVLGSVHFTCEWIIGHDRIVAKELSEVYDQALPEQLRRYLQSEKL